MLSRFFSGKSLLVYLIYDEAAHSRLDRGKLCALVFFLEGLYSSCLTFEPNDAARLSAKILSVVSQLQPVHFYFVRMRFPSPGSKRALAAKSIVRRCGTTKESKFTHIS